MTTRSYYFTQYIKPNNKLQLYFNPGAAPVQTYEQETIHAQQLGSVARREGCAGERIDRRLQYSTTGVICQQKSGHGLCNSMSCFKFYRR